MFLEVSVCTVKTSASLDIPFLGSQDSAGFLGLVRGESRRRWDFHANLFEREIFWRRQTTTQRDETYSSQDQHFMWTNIAVMKRLTGWDTWSLKVTRSTLQCRLLRQSLAPFPFTQLIIQRANLSGL